METTQISSHERAHPEMMEKSMMRDALFALRHSQQRPASVATEFMEDWEMDDEDIISDIDEGDSSPRLSLNSSGGQRSITTLSSYDEVQTPRSTRLRPVFPSDIDAKPVEGPRGPHLFRSSTSSSQVEYQNSLSLSPLTPKVPIASNQTEQLRLPIAIDLTPLPNKRRQQQDGPFQFTDAELDAALLAEWTPEMVAQQMLNTGIEVPACDRFVENDITGAILITLKFEDLKELGIASFGVRTQIWDEVDSLRNPKKKKAEPVPDTDIEDAPDKEARREMRKRDPERGGPKRGHSKRRPAAADDIISPLESVSIVGIEQMMPKPHHCSKGENCRKWQRNKRMMEAFKKAHPFVDMDNGGAIMVAGDPGNPETAEAIKVRAADDHDNDDDDERLRPVSDAIPSVVASSDVMGPGSLPPFQYLAEATLRTVQARDPQDNVRQFLNFQRQHTPASSEVPPTPPFEINLAPQAQPPHQGLRSLPKLSIPGGGGQAMGPPPPRPQPPPSTQPEPPHRSAVASPAEEATPTAAPYRFGTPFSDMDVPLTAVPLGPVARDNSQSVPPDMNYRHNPAPPARSMSRTSARRPSFPVMPALDENSIVTPVARKSPKSFAQRTAVGHQQRPLQPPPRVQYPWSQTDPNTFERAIAPLPGSGTGGNGIVATPGGRRLSPLGSKSKDLLFGDGGNSAISYQGPMRKRRTKMLRHEWNEHYFTLRGTRLAMHKDMTATNRTLEYVDIDDYAIACSSLASGKKLNSAFKAMSLRRGGGNSSNGTKDDIAAFSFQLIPQDHKGGVKLRKRESSVPSSAAASSAAAASASSSAAAVKAAAAAAAGAKAAPPPPSEGVNGTGKTHHFAVKSRDERIDWMRELMLAKALRQKGQGFEISVNGNMI